MRRGAGHLQERLRNDQLSHPADVPEDVSWMVRGGGVLKPNHCFCWPILFLHIICCPIFFSGGIICIWLVPSCDCRDIFGHSSAQGWLWQQNGYSYFLAQRASKCGACTFASRENISKLFFQDFAAFYVNENLGAFVSLWLSIILRSFSIMGSAMDFMSTIILRPSAWTCWKKKKSSPTSQGIQAPKQEIYLQKVALPPPPGTSASHQEMVRLRQNLPPPPGLGFTLASKQIVQVSFMRM